MNNKRLCIHHVGGRFGDGGLPLLKDFEKDFIRVFYDADSDCIEQIKEKFRGSAAGIHVLPYCVGSGGGRGKFNINYDPTSSSIYKLNPDYGPFYFFSYNHDFVASDSIRTMEEREVDVVTIDGVLNGKAAGVPPPDFLSMDAQGAEFSILEGTKNTLNRNVLGLLIETGFHPLYNGQKLFCDVKKMLDDMGFYFVKFMRFMEYSPHRAPVGMRGEGFQIFTDALFLRKADNIKNSAGDGLLKHAMLRKLAFMSIVFNQFEYGVECLDQSRDKKTDYAGGFEGVGYYRFLEEIENGMLEMPLRYPKTFSEKYTFDLSKRRFESGKSAGEDKTAGGWKKLKERLWLRFVYPNIHLVAEIYEFLMEKIWANLFSVLWFNSPVESALRRYGLKEQARLLKKNRAVQYFFGAKTGS